MKLEKVKYPTGQEHKSCESGIMCRKCFWIGSQNGYIGGLQFCLDLVKVYIDEKPCIGHPDEKCEEKNSEHGEARRMIAYISREMKEISDIIIRRAQSEL